MKRNMATALAAASLMAVFASGDLHAGVLVKGRVSSEGRGLPGVVVSDGCSCVLTDSKGRYEIMADDGSRFVSVSVPAGYLPPVEKGSIPRFYKEIGSSDTYDFELFRNPADDSRHVFFVQADVQLIEESNLKAYDAILQDLLDVRSSLGNTDVFGIDCGDIVGDTPSLYAPYIESASALGMPVYRAIGNHDMDYCGRTFETSYRTFGGHFGPTCFSFSKGRAHYVVINNNFYIGRDYFYMGYIDERTFKWLEQDLSHVPEGSLVILAMHIPSRLSAEQKPFVYDYPTIADQTVNAAALHSLLGKYDVHIISGHMHFNQNVCFSDRLMEHNTAAVCGTWWCTDVCLDGTPAGYGIYEVDGSSVTWKYKGSGKPLSYQARAYLPGASEEYPDAVIANVWNWDPEWKVEWTEDGKVMGEMERFTGYDPYARRMCEDKSVIKYDWIGPTRTEHLFKAVPSDPDAEIGVRVTDRFGNVYVCEAE